MFREQPMSTFPLNPDTSVCHIHAYVHMYTSLHVSMHTHVYITSGSSTVVHNKTNITTTADLLQQLTAHEHVYIVQNNVVSLQNNFVTQCDSKSASQLISWRHLY